MKKQEINIKNDKPLFIIKNYKQDDKNVFSFTLTLARPKGQHKKNI